MRYLTGRNAGSRIRSGRVGAVEAVVDVFRNDAGSATMPAYACGALRNLSGSIGENVALSGTADAVEAVVAVMRIHADSTHLQECAEQQPGTDRGRFRSCGCGAAQTYGT